MTYSIFENIFKKENWSSMSWNLIFRKITVIAKSHSFLGEHFMSISALTSPLCNLPFDNPN